MDTQKGNVINQYGVNGFTLKLIAIITMMIDHIGAIIYPEIILFRIIGRISFPIFCAFVAEGAYYTSNIRRYELRLLLFAFVSEVPFDLAFHNAPMEPSSQNVFFTLFLGLVCIDILQKSENRTRFILICFIILFAQFTYCDYGAFGVLLILIFYRFRQERIKAQSIFILFNLAYWGIGVQAYAGLASVFLMLYSGKHGPRLKWFFYLFYPLHLLILWWIWRTNFNIV